VSDEVERLSADQVGRSAGSLYLECPNPVTEQVNRDDAAKWASYMQRKYSAALR
jgi:hypothetical protein